MQNSSTTVVILIFEKIMRFGDELKCASFTTYIKTALRQLKT